MKIEIERHEWKHTHTTNARRGPRRGFHKFWTCQKCGKVAEGWYDDPPGADGCAGQKP